MDSFYEAPRSALKPTPAQSNLLKPLVPEVSMMFDSNNSKLNDSVYLSYQAWRERNGTEALTTRDCQFDRKNPTHADNPAIEHNMGIQPFEQMYMANLPNRHLDLSIIELPNPNPREIKNITPNINLKDTSSDKPIKASKAIGAYDYEGWCMKRDSHDKLLTCDSNRSGVTAKNQLMDLYNYKKQEMTKLNTQDQIMHSSNICCGHSVPCKKYEEPTIKELLKIIQQQNDQLLILQKQVATLIDKDATKAAQANAIMFEERCKTSTQLENPYTKPHQFHPKKEPLRQISLDVMTSFELSIRRPPNTKMYQPHIVEVSESSDNVLDGIARPKDMSLSLNEPELQVQERSPTPPNSIKIDMKDYNSDSSDDEQSCHEFTFYNDIMAHVNYILKKSGMRPSNTEPSVGVQLKHKDAIKKINEAVACHLNGVKTNKQIHDVDAFNNDKKVPSKNGRDISFAIQRFMKYLPDDCLAKLADYQQNFKKAKQTNKMNVQYMQKINVSNDPENGKSPAYERGHFDRILDTTAIRQQPKLL